MPPSCMARSRMQGPECHQVAWLLSSVSADQNTCIFVTLNFEFNLSCVAGKIFCP